ncbi:MAG TPA: lytic transglycosylase domain-containing protein [Methyloceanibacter sp.]|nr:lytic transglycosylase domain-containing protein [Methyloceanibacter sp.]
MPAVPVAEAAAEAEAASPSEAATEADEVSATANAEQAAPEPDGVDTAETVAVPERNPAAPIVGGIVIPNRNPATTSIARSPDPAAPNPGPMASVSSVAMPDRNPKAPSLLAPALPVPPAPQLVTDMPLPDPNPNRADALLHTMKGTLAPAISEPRAAMDYESVLKPILSYQLSSGDESAARETIRSNIAAASRIKDPAAKDFAVWYKYRYSPGGGNPAKIEAFRLAHPDWPGQDELREKAETVLFLDDASIEDVKAFFSDTKPQTGAGKAALAGVRKKEGDEAAARELVVSAWRDHGLNASIEKKILDKYASWLTEEHHRARIDHLLFPDERNAVQAARRVAKLLPADEQKKFEARIAVVQRGGNAGKLLNALPASAVEADVGLRLNNIQWLRRTKDKERREQAWKLLLDTPSEPNLVLDLNNLWTERRINCRGALNDGNPKIAYDIAAKHGLVSGDGFIEAEFLAGWIALRFLNDPNAALKHFVSLRGVATSSKSIALGEYWLGRTALVFGDSKAAMVHFHAAAKYPQHFYGQLARQSIDARPAHLEITSTPLPTKADIEAFISRDAVRAIGVALATGYDSALPQFFLALARKLTNPAEVVLLVELAKITGNRQVGLRLAKIAFNRDLPLGDYALPVGVMPTFKSLLTDRVDPALVHALSRQESEFNAAAKSPVGAAGLMQLMPATARATARAYKVKFDASQLTNAAYNTQLGEAHLRDLIDSYNGSYFLSLAAYNAGGGRVAEWIKKFGDPRDPQVDPVDWIERVPFTETRHYIIKIMETLQLYRSRLAGPKQALQLVQDLNRGRRIPHADAAAVGAQAKSE